MGVRRSLVSAEDIDSVDKLRRVARALQSSASRSRASKLDESDVPLQASEYPPVQEAARALRLTESAWRVLGRLVGHIPE